MDEDKRPEKLIDKIAERERDIRQQEYTEYQQGYEATRSFDEVADNKEFANLENKIAVFYLDGNNLGTIQLKDAKTAKEQTHFDRHIKACRRQFLASLLEQWLPQEKHKKIPLETLLWGGR